jgi:hypothetical protein
LRLSAHYFGLGSEGDFSLLGAAVVAEWSRSVGATRSKGAKRANKQPLDAVWKS